MLDILLLRPSLHFTQLHFNPLHYPVIWFNPISISYRCISPHTTTLHLTWLHCTFRWFSPHFYYFHFTPFISAFLTLFLKISGKCKALVFLIGFILELCTCLARVHHYEVWQCDDLGIVATMNHLVMGSR